MEDVTQEDDLRAYAESNHGRYTLVGMLLIGAGTMVGATGLIEREPILGLVAIALIAAGAVGLVILSNRVRPAPSPEFTIELDGLRRAGQLHRFADVVAARETWDGVGFWSRRDVALYLEFDDGTHFGIDKSLADFKVLQEAVKSRLPIGVRLELKGNAVD